MRFPSFNLQAGTFDIGRFGRAPIELHAGFFLVALALTLPFWKRGTLSGLALAVIGIAIIFGSVLIHELAHAMLARRYNIPVARIDIHMFGGTVMFGWRPSRLPQDVGRRTCDAKHAGVVRLAAGWNGDLRTTRLPFESRGLECGAAWRSDPRLDEWRR